METKYVIKNSHGNMRDFGYLIYSAFSLILLPVLVLLPLAPVFASENEIDSLVDPNPITTTESVTPDETTQSNETSTTQELSIEGTTEETDSSSEGLNIGETLIDVVDGTALESVDTSNATDVDEVTLSENIDTTEVNSDDVNIEEIVTNAEATVDTEDIPILDDTQTDPLPEEQITADELLNTNQDMIIQEDVEEPQQEVVPLGSFESVSTATDENTISFSKTECVRVSDGSFYCKSGTTTPDVTGVDRVFSAPDSDGDLEIYIEKLGILTQITSNKFDDDAPHYDEESNSIVWHRLINDRYQIVAYSLDDSSEEQITHDRFNNMQPSRYDGVTVWQGWVGNDWEIFLLQGDTISMITDNTTDDISPRVNGNYIIWQAYENNIWRVKVYDRQTQKIDTIADADGSSIDNPRFVLVYDSKHENGDIETKGYDLETGKVTQLSSRPAPVPKEIPDPEQTGEKRALVQTGTQLKTKSDADDIDPNSDLPSSATSTDETIEDVVIAPYINESDATSTVNSSAPLETIPDIIIDQNFSSSTPDGISDLIITPYVEQIIPTE